MQTQRNSPSQIALFACMLPFIKLTALSNANLKLASISRITERSQSASLFYTNTLIACLSERMSNEVVIKNAILFTARTPP